MNNKTHSVKLKEIEKKWHIIDASNKPLGRVASEAAKLLMGKHKPTFSKHIDCGDHVIIINSDLVVLTGDKLNKKTYKSHSGYIGGLKTVSAKIMLERYSNKALTLAVKGMLPKNVLGRSLLTKLRVYRDDKHEQQAQMPEVWNF